MKKDTIFSLASGGGKAGICVYRLSGPGAGAVLQSVTGLALPTPRMASRVRISDPQTGEHIDDGLMIWFPSPASYTGEDVAELHLHGGRAVQASISELLARDLRLAEPGEFTRRAFENGKMDLTQAEALGDLIEAETAAQRRQAQRQMEGALGELYDGWHGVLLDCRARLEAAVDFSEEDLPEGLVEAVEKEAALLAGEIGRHLDDQGRGETLRRGFEIAIIGPPNAGKSSLLNALAKRDVAIVAPMAGTTRDVLELHLDLNGYGVTICDTAGLAEGADEVEAEGVRRARLRAQSSDLVIALFDGAKWPELDEETLAHCGEETIQVVNKVDLEGVPNLPFLEEQSFLGLSVLGGEGMEALLSAIGEKIGEGLGGSEEPVLTRARHRQGLEKCVASLDRFAEAPQLELGAEDLRLAGQAMGRLTGKVGVEDILDAIFAKFCIGK